ncbi:MAG: rhodanese-related sulfurtransferase [Pseudomonadota bacterium]
MFKVAAFYLFTPIADPAALKAQLGPLCEKIKGTILVAPEGINSTVSGSEEDIDTLLAFLKSQFPKITWKISYADTLPFYRMKIRIKKEIVTLRRPEAKPFEKTGVHVDAKEWNRLMQDPDIIVLDVRNDYEVAVGTFKNAIDPKTKVFTEFVDYVETHLAGKKDKPIAMLCTGGIRCEKASAFMLANGFQNVYQLNGGILQYLEDVAPTENLWEGECFVFDGRTTVNPDLAPGQFELCHGCRQPLMAIDKQSADFEKGVSCPHCIHTTTDRQKRRFRDRQKQIDLARARGAQHIGACRL